MSAFSGGEKLKLFLEQLYKELTAGDPVVRVGFLEGSTCGRNNDASSPEVAFILEHGAPAANIPPRPFFKNMIERRKSTWGGTLRRFLKANNNNARKALLGTGLIMAEQLQLEITEFTDPANADSTAAAKGFNKPLEDSKNMKRSVAAEVSGERIQVSMGN
jgi:hypothetical protein